MSQREDFEEAASRMGYSLRMRDLTSEDGDYGDRETQGAWDMWQECCALKTKAEPVAWLCLWPDGSPWGAVTDRNSVDVWVRRESEGRTVCPLYTQPQSAVPEWIKCSERMPTEADGDDSGDVFCYDEGTDEMEREFVLHVRGYTHWMPTGLKPPAKPQQEQES